MLLHVHTEYWVVHTTVKPLWNNHSQKEHKSVYKTNYCLMQIKSIGEFSKGSILQFFWPSLGYHLSIRSLFCLFLSSRFTQVLRYHILPACMLLHVHTEYWVVHTIWTLDLKLIQWCNYIIITWVSSKFPKSWTLEIQIFKPARCQQK